MPSPSPIPDSRLRERAWPALAPGTAARPQPADTAACLGPAGGSCKRAWGPGRKRPNYTQISFSAKICLAESRAVTKQRAHCAEYRLCPHSLGSLSNCRGAVAGAALGGGSHGCTKVRAAVTSHAKDVDGEQHELFRRVRLACLQSTICPGGSLPHMSRSLWLFTAYGCTKVFAGQRL
jgi:hypothetical protein